MVVKISISNEKSLKSYERIRLKGLKNRFTIEAYLETKEHMSLGFGNIKGE